MLKVLKVLNVSMYCFADAELSLLAPSSKFQGLLEDSGCMNAKGTSETLEESFKNFRTKHIKHRHIIILCGQVRCARNQLKMNKRDQKGIYIHSLSFIVIRI